jgi:nucleoside 2-deoxyribosyltransferase
MTAPFRVYLAGPLFTAGERAFNQDLASRISAAAARRAIAVLLPQAFCSHLEGDGAPDFPAIRRACLAHLAKADLVLAILDGPDIDSGTAYECGVAFAKGIPAIGLRTDLRPAEHGVGNCMITAPIRVHRTVDAAVADVARRARRRLSGR